MTIPNPRSFALAAATLLAAGLGAQTKTLTLVRNHNPNGSSRVDWPHLPKYDQDLAEAAFLLFTNAFDHLLMTTDGTPAGTNPLSLPPNCCFKDLETSRRYWPVTTNDPILGEEPCVIDRATRAFHKFDLAMGPVPSMPVDTTVLTRNRILVNAIRNFQLGIQPVIIDVGRKAWSAVNSAAIDYGGAQAGNSYVSGTFRQANGHEPVVIDLGNTGNFLVEIVPGPGSSWPENFLAVDPNTVVFSAADASGDKEPYELDVAGLKATRIANLNPNGSSLPANFTWLDGKLLFTAEDGSGRGVFVHDGDKTARVSPPGLSVPFDPAKQRSFPTVAGKALLFCNTPPLGTEPYLCDGTGVVLAKDVTPGAGSTKVVATGSYGGKWFFVTDDGSLWEIGWDGVVRPLVQKVDATQDFYGVGNQLMVMADGGSGIDVELHSMPLDATAIAHGPDVTTDTPCLLEASAPILGRTLNLAARTGTGGGLTLSLLGASGSALPVQGLGEVWLDPLRPVFVLGVSVVYRHSAQLQIPLPASAADLIGAGATLQMLHVDQGRALHLAMSNPVRLRFDDE